MNKYLGEFTVIYKMLVSSQRKDAFLEMMVSGNKGQFMAYYYRDAEMYSKLLDEYSDISIDGYYRKNRGKADIVVSEIRIGMNVMLKEYSDRLTGLLANVTDEYCRTLFKAILDDKKLYRQFISVPDSLAGQYSYVCGLLVKTVEMMEASLKLAKEHNDIDVSLVLTSMFIKAIGKAKCYRGDGFSFKMTRDGNQFGSMELAQQILLDKSQTIGNFPALLFTNLNKIIRYESYGDLKPASSEARLICMVEKER
jgi:hypothetical protein